ncbi:RluA family pseudouridine synthase [Roseateles violae]|uniref:Pseudouridine synthase n=1 Tax=Roseateles violae TaxID=3058042 RepID=A0ABT8DX71_9BURK|nr:pseudouridine synthase [Pelomonas sp. PFR6]MDN3921913.1 pseudouridine synthase [Pelomonas sp. PFR6]
MDIVHLDAEVIVVNKPAGLLSVPGRGEDKQDCAIHRVQRVHPEALIVHRLDMATSGLLLLARGAAMQRRLSMAFAERRVHKRYIALLQGRLATEGWAEVDLPLICDWPNRPRQMVDPVRGKPSRTRYRVLERGAAQTRVELEPITGRTHQLRVHMLALGHAIVGDTLYAADTQPPAPRLLLHASRLSLPELGLQLESAPEF